MKRIRDDAKQCAQPVVAFYAHKGGVGKTTSCLTTAVRAVQKGLRVVVLDCDPQQNATAFLSQWQGRKYFDFEADYRAMAEHYRVEQIHSDQHSPGEQLVLKNYGLAHRNLYDLLSMVAYDTSIHELWASMPSTGYVLEATGLSVVAAHPMLSAYDNHLAFEVGNRAHPPNYMARMGWLLKYLVQRNDLVLLDLSPSNSFFNQMALASCSHFVVPVTGDKFSIQSMDTLDLMLGLVRRNFTDRLERPVPLLLCVLYNQYKSGPCMMTGFAYHRYSMHEDDAKQCLQIDDVFHSLEKSLAPFMSGQRQPRLVAIQKSGKLHKKLGHNNMTVFDPIDATVSAEYPKLADYRGFQQGDYDLLWNCIHSVLFPTCKAWL